MNLREDSEYSHERHGRVRLVTIDHDAGDVLFECTDREPIHIACIGSIPSAMREPIHIFESHAEPAPVTISPPAAEIDSDGVDIG